MRVILASASPRRRQLIAKLFDDAEIMPQSCDENCAEPDPERRVTEIALRKLGDLPEREPDALIIASDTLVYMDGVFYGKPTDAADAARMLRELSGRTHTVYTAVAFAWAAEKYTLCEQSAVCFRALSDDFIAAYVADGSPLDKAGAYGIQDGLVDVYVGSYDNIVGLPTEALAEALGRIGIRTKERRDT